MELCDIACLRIPLSSMCATAGEVKRNRRCPDCGSSLWGEIDGMPDVLALQAGTLDDTTWLKPIAHIFTTCAQPWVEIPTDVHVYETEPEDKLVRLWKGRDAG